jgi:hypothetical protein
MTSERHSVRRERLLWRGIVLFAPLAPSDITLLRSVWDLADKELCQTLLACEYVTFLRGLYFQV